jgi:hypothetical protein
MSPAGHARFALILFFDEGMMAARALGKIHDCQTIF